jgi:hypothetical protein
LDYAALTRHLDSATDAEQVGAALMAALAGRYGAQHEDCVLLHFDQGAPLVFDLASSVALAQEDRTVAAWA